MRDLLANAIEKNKSIVELDLGSNRIGQDGGRYLFMALHSNTTMKVLKLSHCNVQDQGAKAAQNMLLVNTTLKKYVKNTEEVCELTCPFSLYLDHNGISSKSLCFIASALEHNQTLTTLYLWGNDFSNDSCEVIFLLL